VTIELRCARHAQARDIAEALHCGPVRARLERDDLPAGVQAGSGAHGIFQHLVDGSRQHHVSHLSTP
jgi:hypothetical protein